MKTVITEKVIIQDDENFCFGERNIFVRMVDEAAGAFFEISDSKGKMSLTVDEMQFLLEEAKKMIYQVEPLDK